MNADEWREAVEELRDYCQESQRTMVRFNHTDRADVYDFVTEALTALLDRDEADRAEGALPDHEGGEGCPGGGSSYGNQNG